MEIDKQYNDTKSNFIQALNKLANDIDAWQQQYIVTSPGTGIATFQEVIRENAEVSAGTAMFFVEPPGKDCYAQIMVEQYNFGKLSLQQTVIIRLPSFPFQEYGSLEGRIAYISHMPNKDKQYVVRVILNNGMVTNTGKQINFTNELQAEAQIITRRTRLVYKFLYTIQGLFRKVNAS